eukprot:COSAG02_NODE_632_length_19286_cov_1518.762235_9_plen_56_part_00
MDDEMTDYQTGLEVLCARTKVRQASKVLNVSVSSVAVHLPQSRFACARLITYSLP